MEKLILQEKSNFDECLLQKKFEIMIEMNNKKINNELNNINSMVNKLNEEISEIKKSLSENRPITEDTEPVIDEKKEDQKELSKEKSNEQLPKPRYGDYKPGDVDINKFFYFGSNRK